KAKTSPDEVRTVLDTLPQGYDDSYKETMDRIEATSLSNPHDLPLTLAQLQEALAIDLQKPDYVTSHRHDKDFLLEITAGLLYVDGDENVNLCHNTAQEYFTKTREAWFPNSASQIARSCLQFLNRSEFASPSEGTREFKEFDKRRKTFPFLAYAYLFWGNHVHDAGQDDQAQQAALRYLEDHRRVAAFVQAAWLLDSSGIENWDERKGISSLHVAAWFGLSELIPHLLSQESNVNIEDRNGHTPLMFACRRGHHGAASLLLDSGASVNLRSHSESTALFEAVRNNHSEVMTVLLGSSRVDVNIQHWREAERTALMFAAKDDYVEILSELLGNKRIDVNMQDLYGNTALMIAAKAGRSEAVLHLLRHENIDVNALDQTGSTALVHAAKWNHSDIVDQLLASGAKPNERDQNGGTALLRAIDYGYTDVVERMLDYTEVDISTIDTLDRTLLHGAAVNGHADIIRLLIDRGLDKDAQDNQGRTPLHEACRCGKADVVNLLLTLGANRSAKDRWHRTVWDVAWLHGHAKIMLILNGEPTDPASVKATLEDYPDLNALPIWSLASMGRSEEIILAIRQRPRHLAHLDPDTDNTALHAAVLADHPQIIEMLLQAGLSPDSQNAQSRTSLHLAVLYGFLDCTKTILAYTPNLNIEDEFHQTPLLIAQVNTQPEIALLLIEAGAQINPHKIQVQSFFFQAIELAQPKALQILIYNGANVAEKNKIGKTALRVAKDVAAEAEDNDVADNIGQIIQILQVNKSRFVKMTEEHDEEEEEETHRFQMSAFQRKDIWEELQDEETPTTNPPANGNHVASPLRKAVPT
ncbi:MAG: hypothetical protein Q9218_008129, partial [Villophora microphyllina]